MTTVKEIESVLQTYELEEIFELNDLTDAEILYYLVDQEFLKLPEPEPMDVDIYLHE